MAITPNMGLVEPTVLVTTGPQWANNLNASLTTIDTHDHTSGKGVQVPSAGININADLSYTGFGPVGMDYASFTVGLSQPPSSSLPASLYVFSGDIYYQSAAGDNVQITSGGAINASGIGTADANGFYPGGGLGYLNVASANYDQTAGYYVFHTTTTNNSSGDFNNMASVVAGNLITAGSLGQRITLADSASFTTMIGGVGFITSNSFTTYGLDIRADNVVDGSYQASLINFAPASFSSAALPAYSTIIGGVGNPTFATWTETGFGGQVLVGTTPDLSLSHALHSYFVWRGYTGTSAGNNSPDAGSSYDVRFGAAWGSAGLQNAAPMARIVPYWAAANGAMGGFRIQVGHASGADNTMAAGVWSTTGIIDVNENGGFGGGPGIGLGGSPTSAGVVTLYGITVPAVNGSSLGSSAKRFSIQGTSADFTGTLDVDGAVVFGSTLSVTGDITIGGVVSGNVTFNNDVSVLGAFNVVAASTLSGTLDVGSAVSLQDTLDVAGITTTGDRIDTPWINTTDTATTGQLTTRNAQNNIVAWGRYDNAGIFIDGWNVNGNAVHNSAGNYTVTLALNVNTGNALSSNVHVSGTKSNTSTANFLTSSTIQICTYDVIGTGTVVPLGDPTDLPFSFICIGH